MEGKTILPVIFITVLILCMSGCRNNTEQRLRSIENCIPAHPDSCRMLLDEFDTTRLNSDEMALLTILRHEANYKCYERDTDEFKLLKAINIIDKGSNQTDKAKGRYYLGIVLLNKECTEKALIEFMRALSLLESHNSSILKAHVLQHIADCFRLLFDSASEVHYYKRAYEEFKKHNNDLYTDYALYEVASAYYNNVNYDSALFLSREIYQKAIENNNVVLKADALKLIAKSLIELKQFNEAVRILSGIIANSPEEMENSDLISLGIAFMGNGQLYKAIALRDSMAKNGEDSNWLDFLIACEQENYKTGIEKLRIEDARADSVIAKRMHRNTAYILDNYYHIEKIKDQNKTRDARQKTLWASIIGVLVFIIAVLIIVLIKATHRKEMRGFSRLLESMRTRVSSLTKEIDSKNSIISAQDNISKEYIGELGRRQEEIQRLTVEVNKLTSNTNDLLKDRMELIDRLCGTLYEVAGGKSEERRMYAEAMAIVKKLQGKKGRTSLEIKANAYFNNIVDNLRSDISSLTETEETIFLFILYKLSTRSIAFLLDTSIETIYTRKSNLKRKILTSQIPQQQKDYYLSFL